MGVSDSKSSERAAKRLSNDVEAITAVAERAQATGNPGKAAELEEVVRGLRAGDS